MRIDFLKFFIIFLIPFSCSQSDKKNCPENSAQVKQAKTVKAKTPEKLPQPRKYSKISYPSPEAIREIPSGEGQWPWNDLDKLDVNTLKNRGFELLPEKIWKKGKGLAKAAVGLPGCSGSFISPDGLIITNHHCAFGMIQKNSTADNNILEKGFSAASRKDELDGKGMKIWVFGPQKDVTKTIRENLDSIKSDYKRGLEIEKRISKILAECEKDGVHRCSVSRENSGLRYLLLKNFLIRDVRLVAAPPKSIGEYGGEVDNWQWPRHTLDFSVMRAYVSPDGKGKSYDKNNVPFKPEVFFKISTKGLKTGDAVMVLGTPYHTNRYATSYEIARALNEYYPFRVKLFEDWILTLEKNSRDPSSKLLSSTWIKRLNNGLTNSKGMIRGIERNNLIMNKKRQEKDWKKWVAGKNNKRWTDSYDNLLKYLMNDTATWKSDMILSYMFRGLSLYRIAMTAIIASEELPKKDQDRLRGYQKRDHNSVISSLKMELKNFNPEVEIQVFGMFLRYLKASKQDLDPLWKQLNINKLENLYKTTKLNNPKALENIFKGDYLKQFSSDPYIKLVDLMKSPFMNTLKRNLQNKGAMQNLRVPYLESLISFLGQKFYPDANASPRISFAHVAPYYPQQGELHTPFTTITGMIAKKTGKWPFVLPEGFIDMHSKTHLSSRFSDKTLKDIPACFLSNADTTGGNSGSAVLNSKGELVGLNFDRVFSNIAGDYGYNKDVSRNVMTDIRAVLWYMENMLKSNILHETVFSKI
ncbi:MAG: S46 family peptidase [Deltaproteobacteria bacterium]|nr:S46 family peptidase [Deltaproteobacteria bacterium]